MAYTMTFNLARHTIHEHAIMPTRTDSNGSSYIEPNAPISTNQGLGTVDCRNNIGHASPAVSLTSPNNNMNAKINKKLPKLPENLKLHGKTPSGKPRLFVCSVCTRAFARQEHLTRHSRSHTHEKPYHCGICERKFTRRDLLLRHANKVHAGNCGDYKTRLNTRSKRRSRKTDHADTEPRNKVLKRRNSFSAQSAENYAKHEFDTQTQNDVKFSTPTLPPVDLVDFNSDLIKLEGTLNFDLDVDDVASLTNSNNSDNSSYITDGNLRSCSVANSVKILGDDLISETAYHGLFEQKWDIHRPVSDFENKPLDHDNIDLVISSTNLTPSVSNASPNIQASLVSPENDLINFQNFNLNMQSMLNDFINIDAVGKELTVNQRDRKEVPVLESSTNFKTTLSSPVNSKYEDNSDDAVRNLDESYYTFYGLDELALNGIPDILTPNNILTHNKAGLFSWKLREICKVVLEYYNQHCDVRRDGDRKLSNTAFLSKDLVLPTCDELNEFVTLFEKHFLPHQPFIHADVLKLNLPDLYRFVNEIDNTAGKYGYTHIQNRIDEALRKLSNNDESQIAHALELSSLVCLPLFIATFGSIYQSESHTRTIELYEISRRVLHVYLETEKEITRLSGMTANNEVNTIAKGLKIWLVQAMSLSIIFGFFADYLERIDTELVKRQVVALCTIIRQRFLDSITFNTKSDQGLRNNGLEFDNQFTFVIFESKIRITLLIYQFCQLLKIFYNLDAKLFLNELDINPIFIPVSENIWNNLKLADGNLGSNEEHISDNGTMRKSLIDLQQFYHSFAFKATGITRIPESLASSLLYYEMNVSKRTKFHIFLTRIDTRKLENNIYSINEDYIDVHETTESDPRIIRRDGQRKCESRFVSGNLPTLDSQAHIERASLILKNDANHLKNCLMTLRLFDRFDKSFGAKCWKSDMKKVYNKFLDSKKINFLNQASYNLLADFLVSLNFSIKNISQSFELTENNTKISFKQEILPLFAFQGFYYSFLSVIKFLNDFESTPNFKLLSIYSELKKLANNLLIPMFSAIYPESFDIFSDVKNVNNFIKINSSGTDDLRYSNINVVLLEKLINNILVSSFNDPSFLSLDSATNNEFHFNNNHPTYYPFAIPVTESNKLVSSDHSNESSLFKQPNLKAHNIKRNTANNPVSVENDYPRPSQSSLDLLLKYNLLLSSKIRTEDSSRRRHNQQKEDFSHRYHLSEKYLVIGQCFFKYMKDKVAHCYILDKMSKDFATLYKLKISNNVFIDGGLLDKTNDISQSVKRGSGAVFSLLE